MFNLGPRGQIIRSVDKAIIPIDEMNSDYQMYLAWKKEGNVLELVDDELDFKDLKTKALLFIYNEGDQKICESNLIPKSTYASEMVTDIALMVMEWITAGRPESTMPLTIASRVKTEADIYGITPLEMIRIWEQKWLEMRNGLSPIITQRRIQLLELETIEDGDVVEIQRFLERFN